MTHNVSVYLTKSRGFNLGELNVKKCIFKILKVYFYILKSVYRISLFFYYLFIFTIFYATVGFSSVEAQIIHTVFFSTSSMLPVLKHGSLQGLVMAQKGKLLLESSSEEALGKWGCLAF